MNDNVIVTSMVGGQVCISKPHLRFQKEWPRKGTKLPVSKEILREIIYEPGVEYMFKKGILYIDDMDFKIELGLEQPGATTPTIVALDDKYLNRLTRLMPISEMKKAVESLTTVQKQELVDYTVMQKDLAMDRIKVISDLCHVDVLKTMTLVQQKGE